MSNELTPTFGISARIWWNITWKTILCAIPFSFLGGFLGVMLGMLITGGNEQLANNIASVCSYLAAIPIAIFVIKSSLNETYGEYRLSLVKEDKVECQDSFNKDTKIEPTVS